MMTCKEAASIAGDVLDNNAPFKIRMGVGAHVIMCKNCRLYFKQMKSVVGLLSKLEQPEEAPSEGPSPEVEAMLRQAFAAKHGQG